jgi:hypothetical protein
MLVRLEMDEKRMSLTAHIAPNWATLPTLALHLGLGFGLGLLYFNLVWGSARQFAAGGRTATSILLVFGRLAVLGIVLVLTSLEGAGPLLATALGLLLARPVVMRRHREALT